ncbi:hypothetical protein JS533_012385 [Bifidobacterium amazonense]|uniref:Uncharacterized protein n=1 Tax=Bifidobacterium amazonense TaxID=2809027 RepID=A0ABS9VY56_9BIFI|nr:hypothetical protein [Bifidobacterium amazonense]MCH9277052.1 hypothetical protein [Bifidobacterium amazonense]
MTEDQQGRNGLDSRSTATADAVPSGAHASFAGRYAAGFALLPLMVVLVLAFGGAGTTGLAVWTAVLMIAFLICSPLRDGIPGRVIAEIAGVASFCFACYPGLLSWAMFGLFGDRTPGVSASALDQFAWFAGVGGLLIALIVVSFIRQMARAERSHLIRGLSHSVLDGVAMIAAPGWLFLPGYMALPDAGASNTAMFLSAIIVILLMLALVVASNWWMAEADPDEHARAPWLGIIVLPALLSAPLIPLASSIAALLG